MGKQEPQKRKVIVKWEDEGFDLHFDKEKAQLLNLLFSTFFKISQSPLSIMMKGNKQIIENMWDFAEEFAKPFHDNGFCTDPECSYYDEHEN